MLGEKGFNELDLNLLKHLIHNKKPLVFIRTQCDSAVIGEQNKFQDEVKKVLCLKLLFNFSSVNSLNWAMIRRLKRSKPDLIHTLRQVFWRKLNWIILVSKKFCQKNHLYRCLLRRSAAHWPARKVSRLWKVDSLYQKWVIDDNRPDWSRWGAVQ